MKKIIALILTAAALSGCVGMSSTDGDSTKNWIKIDSSRSDLSGKVEDVCYRLDIRFNPAEAANAINTDLACITKCCWYSERKVIEINMNENFPRDLAAKGRAIKFSPEKITFYMSYSSFLNTIHGKVEPSGVLKSGGLIMLEATEVKAQSPYLTVGHEPFEAAVYEDETPAGTYLFKKDDPASAVKKEEKTPVFADLQERHDYLQKKLAYEREQAVLLLKRFYAKDIDAYVMTLDKAQRAKGMTLLANDRSWVTTKVGSPIYHVTCKVNGRLGKTQADMKPYPINCGIFKVDLDEQTVSAVDSVARSIVSGEFKN